MADYPRPFHLHAATLSPASFDFLLPPVLERSVQASRFACMDNNEEAVLTRRRKERRLPHSTCHDRSPAFKQVGVRRALRRGVAHTAETVLVFHRLGLGRARHVGPEKTQSSKRHVFDPHSLWRDPQAELGFAGNCGLARRTLVLIAASTIQPTAIRPAEPISPKPSVRCFRVSLPDDGHDFGPPRPCQP